MNVIRKEIQKALSQTKEELQALQKQLQPIVPECAIGTLSRFEMMHDQERIHSAYLLVKKRHEALIHALEHLDSPDFGRCEVCDEPIKIERLLAIPETRMCVRCASEAGL